jgi:hypothetical protein
MTSRKMTKRFPRGWTLKTSVRGYSALDPGGMEWGPFATENKAIAWARKLIKENSGRYNEVCASCGHLRGQHYLTGWARTDKKCGRLRCACQAFYRGSTRRGGKARSVVLTDEMRLKLLKAQDAVRRARYAPEGSTLRRGAEERLAKLLRLAGLSVDTRVAMREKDIKALGWGKRYPRGGKRRKATTGAALIKAATALKAAWTGK